MVLSPAVLSLAAIVLLVGLVVATVRQRPLRLAIPGQIAVTGALAATFVYSHDEPRDGRASYVLSTLAVVMLAYLLASGGRPLRFLPAAFLTGFQEHVTFQRRLIAEPPADLTRLGPYTHGLLVGYVALQGGEPPAGSWVS